MSFGARIDFPEPNPRQAEFLTAKERYVAYGGARGGGKSWAVRTKSILLCVYYPGIRILLLRKTFPELRENHILPLSQILAGVAKYNDGKKVFTFGNGSRIRLGYCDNDKDVLQYQGQEYDVIFMDEATHFTEYQYNAIKSCLRGVNDFPKRFYLTCNPGGVGHGWVKRLFIDREYREGEEPENYRFIRARVYDNAALMEKDPEYVKGLLALPEEMRAAWLDGDWDAFAGRFFPEFKRETHVAEPTPVNYADCKLYRVFDYGLDMLACLWIAVDRYGHATVYRELHEKDLIVSEAAKRILSMTSPEEEIYETLAPPDMWSRQRETGRSIAEIFRDNGIDLIRAYNDRVSGWLNVKEYLQGHLTVYANCTTLIKHISMLQYDQRNPGDAATEPHEITHICDALRYFCASHTVSATVKEEKSELQKAKERRLRQVRRGRR